MERLREKRSQGLSCGVGTKVLTFQTLCFVVLGKSLNLLLPEPLRTLLALPSHLRGRNIMREVPEARLSRYSFGSKRTSSKLLKAGLADTRRTIRPHASASQTRGKLRSRKRNTLLCTGHFLGTGPRRFLQPRIPCPKLQWALKGRDLPPRSHSDPLGESTCLITQQGSVSCPTPPHTPPHTPG